MGIPLYQRIAEHYRYAIATGRLRPGARLPALRRAAAEWGVNLHTVRRAYAEIAREGLVEIHAPGGTLVREAPAGAPPGRLERFILEITERAKREHGLDRRQLVQRIETWQPEAEPLPPALFLECSRSQAEGHAREIAAAFDVDVRGAAFASLQELPRASVLATYFHYNDLRVRWPSKLGTIRFVAIRPDPAVVHRIEPVRSGRTTLVLCESDKGKGESIAADLSLILPPERFRIRPAIVDEPAELLRARSRVPVLFSPRMWDRLSTRQQSDPRAIEVRYVIAADELESIGRHFGWRPRR